MTKNREILREELRRAKEINRLISSRIPSGLIIFQDLMEILRWYKSDSQGVGTVALDNTCLSMHMQAQNVVKIITGTNLNDRTIAAHRFGLPKTETDLIVGFEGYFSLELAINSNQIILMITAVDGVNSFDFYIEINPITGKVYRGVDGPEIGTFSPIQWCPHHFKLVANITTKKWVYAMLDDQIYDLRGESAVGILPNTTRYFWVGFSTKAAEQGTSAKLYFTDIIVTIDEADALP